MLPITLEFVCASGVRLIVAAVAASAILMCPLASRGVEGAEQGWTDADRNWFYTTSQGSRMIPWEWFMALEQPGGQALFRELDYLGGFAYLAPRTLRENPWGLPLGFVRHVDGDGRAHLGFNCTACHTREQMIAGKTLRIDGAPADANFLEFASALEKALEETTADDQRFARFAQRVLGTSHPENLAAELRTELRQFTHSFSALLARSRPAQAYGYGRLDAFNILLNEIVGTGLGMPENYRTPDAPVSYPHLWGTPDQTWVQWNGASDDPLARNVGEVLGVFGELKITETAVQTSAQVENLHLLEERIKLLRAPKWPVAWAPIDAELAERGKVLYAQHCQSCHAAAPRKLPANRHGRELVDVVLVPISAVGTDARAAAGFLTRTAKPGPLAAALSGPGEAKVALVLAGAVRRVLESEFRRQRLTPDQVLAYRDKREPTPGLPSHLDDVPHYKAGSLPGIWATGPFLHNGSVPTLYDLLLPFDQRPVTFQVGAREFDPVRVGPRTDRGPETFNTEVDGNRRTGHEYGTSLEDPQRWQLVEYLKTL